MDSEKKRKCCFPVCESQKFDLVHKLPMGAEQAEQWKNIIASVLPEVVTLSNEEMRRKYFVCYRHFVNSDYKNIESRNLNKTACPSVNLTSLSDNHACPRLRISAPIILNQQFPPVSEKKLATVDLEGFLSPTTLAHKRKSEFASVDHPVASKTMKIYLPKKQDSLTTSKEHGIIEASQTLPGSSKSGGEGQSPMKQKVKANNQPIFILNSSKPPLPAEEETMMFDEFLPVAELSEEPEKVPVSPKKLVALFELTPKQLQELQEQFKNNTVQLLNKDLEKDRQSDTMDYIELVSEKYSTPIKVNLMWLRDHCRCINCYNSETFQRKINLLNLPLDVKPQKYQLIDGRLNVWWNDNHESTYSLEFLHNNQYDVHKSCVEAVDRVLWDNETIQTADYARVKLSDLICNEEPIEVVMRSLIKYGFAFIENVPANTQSTEMAIKRLFPIKKTLFGEMWTFSDNKDHSDTAYTKDFLPAHTDNTYFNDAAGLQVLHCIQHTGSGGLSLLQDGFKALADFKDHFPESYQRLSEIAVPAEYIEDGQHHKYSASIIRLDPLTRQPEQIRFNTFDRAPMNTIPLEKISQFYADYRKLASEIHNAEKEWWFKLEPGTIVIFDNWRVLHGRSAYQGKRVMTGCYVERTDFMSKARVLKLID